ncbi:MAG: signal peptidase II [Bacteroidota bacterium]|jgi:signal peptidase II
MISAKKTILIAFLLVTCIGCDQATKQIAKSSLEFSAPQSLFNDMLRLQYAENPGGMMSFGAELHPEVRFWFLTVFVGLMLFGILIFTFVSTKLTRFQITALTLIVGGGFSNLLDRLLHDGHVIDFLNVGMGSVRTAIFNVADVIIILGTLLLLFSSSQTNKERIAG